MSLEDKTSGAEDLQLEGTEADSVVGGGVNVDSGDQGAYDVESEIVRLQAKGFVAESCTTEGTLMVNRRTGQRRTVGP